MLDEFTKVHEGPFRLPAENTGLPPEGGLGYFNPAVVQSLICP